MLIYLKVLALDHVELSIWVFFTLFVCVHPLTLSWEV
jgi:hypothetical protein